jgi:RNA polymerase sigma-70 factor (ECF subfamily)
MTPAPRAARLPPQALGASSAPEAAEVPARLDAVYERWADYVWRMLQRLGVRHADLEDVCHDVFVIAHRKFHEFDGRVAVNAWLFGICLRVAANYRRRARHRFEQPLSPEMALAAPSSSNPEQRLSRSRAQLLVQRILDQMDLGKRAVFLMFEIEGLSCQEIADHLGIPVGTVHSRLHAARGLFQREARRLDQERESQHD